MCVHVYFVSVYIFVCVSVCAFVCPCASVHTLYMSVCIVHKNIRHTIKYMAMYATMQVCAQV